MITIKGKYEDRCAYPTQRDGENGRRNNCKKIF